MRDAEQIQAQYLRYYDGMLRKDENTLDQVLDDRFILVLTSGQQLNKRELIAAVLGGSLNCIAVRHEALPVSVDGDRGELTGRAQVTAEVFGSRRETLPLQQVLLLEKAGEVWRIVQASASGY